MNTTAVTFTDPDLAIYDKQEITFAGFLVCDQQDHYFLASQPNLKSCCIGKQDQVALNGTFSKDMINQMIQVKGTLSIDKDNRYSIEDPILIEKRSHLWFTTLGLLVLLILCSVYYKSHRKSINSMK